MLARRAATSSGWSEGPAPMMLNNSSMRKAGVAGIVASGPSGAGSVMVADTLASAAPLSTVTAAKAVSGVRRASKGADRESSRL
jgi:hypothetical protein